VITFDTDIVTIISLPPLFCKNSLKATLFVLTDLIGSHKPPWLIDWPEDSERACDLASRPVLPSDTLVRLIPDRQEPSRRRNKKAAAYAKNSHRRQASLSNRLRSVTEEPMPTTIHGLAADLRNYRITVPKSLAYM
jgi:hypothetical protein